MKIYPEFKTCSTCEESLPISEFYFRNDKQLYESICKDCRSQYGKKYLEKKKGIEVWHVYNTPNKYANDRQKQMVFEMMTIMNYEYNPDNGTWFKDDIGKKGICKDKDGNWKGIEISVKMPPNEYQKKWRAEHKEKMKKYQAVYYKMKRNEPVQ